MDYFDIAADFWQICNAVRRDAPLIHNMTNLVVQNDTADAIAAVGATQLTLHAYEEVSAVAAVAAALAVNTGTLDDTWLRSARRAIVTVAERGRPWLLDPVAAGFTAYRMQADFELLDLNPTVLKANASEILAMADGQSAGRAADSIHSVDQATDAAVTIARRHDCVVVVTGASDLITDGDDIVRLENGRPMMGHMIGSGCMLGAVIACFLAVAEDPFLAAQAAVAYFTVAGEIAADQAGGPGTLKPLLLDALFDLDAGTFADRLRLTVG